MKFNVVSWLPGTTAPLWAPSDDGGGSGGGETGNESTGVEGQQSPPAGTALGSAESTPGGGEAEHSEQGGSVLGGASEGESVEDGSGEVPDDGVYDFELPEGVLLDENATASWSKHFHDLGLTRGQAAELVRFQSEQLLADQSAYSDMLQTQQAEHLAAAQADPEIGGDNWAESVRLANKGLEALQGSALKDLILTTGNGNNPEMIRELRRIGALVADDTFEAGASHTAPVPRETAWYGSTTPESKRG